MKKRYAIIAATAIAASLTACGMYGPAPDDIMYEGNNDGITVERLDLTQEGARTQPAEPDEGEQKL